MAAQSPPPPQAGGAQSVPPPHVEPADSRAKILADSRAACRRSATRLKLGSSRALPRPPLPSGAELGPSRHLPKPSSRRSLWTPRLLPAPFTFGSKRNLLAASAGPARLPTDAPACPPPPSQLCRGPSKGSLRSPPKVPAAAV